MDALHIREESDEESAPFDSKIQRTTSLSDPTPYNENADSLSLEKQAAVYLSSEAAGSTKSLSLADYFMSEDATNATYKDISHLGENIHSINVLFGEIMRTLQTYDSEYPDPKGALEPQWAALRKVAPTFYARHNLR